MNNELLIEILHGIRPWNNFWRDGPDENARKYSPCLIIKKNKKTYYSNLKEKKITNFLENGQAFSLR